MLNLAKHLYIPNPTGALDVQAVNRKIKTMYLFLGLANIAVWTWAFISLHYSMALLGSALLAYSFGLRHALDVDHIAAIDNVTRRLMHTGKRPVSIGFFFATGHSMIVVLASFAIGVTAKSVSSYLELIQAYGGLVSNIISIVFLLAIGIINTLVLLDIYRHFKSDRPDAMMASSHSHFSGGLMSRILRPLIGNIQSSWQMILLGIIFGLGFETATEVAVLGTSALQAAQGASLWTILLFPSLFTVGMLTVDATDGVLMLRVYGWAFVKPERKMFYNIMLTLTSTALALLIAGINIADLLQDYYQLDGPIWSILHTVHESYTLFGSIIVAVFIASWLVSQTVYERQSMKWTASR